MNPKQHLSWDHDLAPVFFFWWGFGSGALVLFVVQWAQSWSLVYSRDGHNTRNPAATPAPPPVAIGLYCYQCYWLQD